MARGPTRGVPMRVSQSRWRREPPDSRWPIDLYRTGRQQRAIDVFAVQGLNVCRLPQSAIKEAEKCCHFEVSRPKSQVFGGKKNHSERASLRNCLAQQIDTFFFSFFFSFFSFFLSFFFLSARPLPVNLTTKEEEHKNPTLEREGASKG